MIDPSAIARIAAGRTDLVIDFVGSGGDPASTDGDGVSLLSWCAYYGDVSAMRVLVSRGDSLDTLGPDRGLNGAAFHGHWQLCQYLLENGAQVNKPLADTGETPLHATIASDDRVRYDPVVSVLLAAGADVHARTKDGIETGAFMRDCRTRGETPLHRAAAFGTAATVQLLLDAGTNREVRDSHGDTALSWASWYRRPAEILRLLCYGPHQVRAGYKGMRANLAGDPLVGKTP